MDLVLAYLRARIGSDEAQPLFQQLYQLMREAILTGHWPDGTRLPPSRALSEDLKLSRTTVTAAYHQLEAEGFIQSRVGAGSWVSRSFPAEKPTGDRARSAGLSQRGRWLENERTHYLDNNFHAEAFCPAMTEVDGFAHEMWGRILSRVWRKHSHALMSYGEPAGYLPLRRAVVDYLKETRQISCQPEQVVIVNGSQQGLDLCGRVLLDAGDPVWIEDPGYLGARYALGAAGARLVPVPVDHDGLQVEAGLDRCPDPRAIFVSPSHQFPCGVTMSLRRRQRLLDVAQQTGCWILEDDYDSLFRYSSRPVSSLKSLDQHDRVIYLGSFSKLLFPSMRLGYLVLPEALVTAVHGAKLCCDRHSALMEQAALTEFIESREFIRHVKRMRELYGERRSLLRAQLEARLGGLLEVPRGDEAGLHLVGWLPPGTDDFACFRAAEAVGLEANSLTQYALGREHRPGLVLGYGGIGASAIRQGVDTLARILEELPATP